MDKQPTGQMKEQGETEDRIETQARQAGGRGGVCKPVIVCYFSNLLCGASC